MKLVKVLILTVSFTVLLLSSSSIAVANVTSMYVTPDWQQVDKGDIFNVDIGLNNSDSTVLDTVLSWLSYDPSKLEVQDSNSGQAGIQILNDPLGLYGFNFHMVNSVDPLSGKIDFEEGFQSGGSTNATGTFARITFKALDLTSSTPLVFNFDTWGFTPTTAVLRGGNDVLAFSNDHADGAFGGNIAVVPEPGSLILFLSGLSGTAFFIRKKKSDNS